jgi:signal peptidase I
MWTYLRKRCWWLLSVLGGLGLIPAYLRAYTLAGPSDIPTVLLGDLVIVNTAAYRLSLPYSHVELFHTGRPKRGDFALVHLMNDPRLKAAFFKRIIGLPGETIEIRENRVIINDRPIPVRELNVADFAWVPKAHPIGTVVQDEDGHWITFTPGKSEQRNHPPVHLSDREYFVLGDNRDDSMDSREFGPLSEDLLLGKMVASFATGPRVK